MSSPRQHTPGPWSAVSYINGKIALEDDQGLGTIALVDTVHTIKDPREQEANARLIASAPDLLAELERTEASLTAILCSRVIDSTTSTWLELRRNRDAIRAAIARATGGNAL